MREKPPELSGHDIAVISDLELGRNESAKATNIWRQIEHFVDEDVSAQGKVLIITGGSNYSLFRRNSNDEVTRLLGGYFSGNKQKEVKVDGMSFHGYNKFHTEDGTTVVKKWHMDDRESEDPALIVKHLGKGKIVIFTSDCSPVWGDPKTIQSNEFVKVLKEALSKEP